MSRNATDNNPRTAIMGAGNVLMGDDGIGVRVVEALKNVSGLPGDIEMIDAGTATLEALALIEDVEHLIIIDAVKGGGRPGTIYRLSPGDITEPSSRKISLHQMSLLEALNANRMLGAKLPRISIIGIEPKTISSGMALSKEVGDQIPHIISAITALIGEPQPVT